MEVKFQAVTEEHILELAEFMQAADIIECLDAGFLTGLEAVRHSVTGSEECWCCTVDGRVLAIFGVIPENLLLEQGTLWLLTTTLVREKPKTFVKFAKRALAVLRVHWKSLSVGIGGTHQSALAFARRAGFRFVGTTGHASTGAPFMLHTIGG